MTTTHEAITAISRAAGALTLSAERSPGAPLTWIEPELALLERAVSRLRTLVTMHPETKVDQPLPAGAISEGDLADRAQVIDALQTSAAMPSEPVSLVLHARTLDEHDDSPAAAIRSLLDGTVLFAEPAGYHYSVDVNRLSNELAALFPSNDY